MNKVIFTAAILISNLSSQSTLTLFDKNALIELLENASRSSQRVFVEDFTGLN